MKLTSHISQIKRFQEHMVHRGSERAFVATPAKDLAVFITDKSRFAN